MRPGNLGLACTLSARAVGGVLMKKVTILAPYGSLSRRAPVFRK